jgi:hypothetical protein
MTPLEQLQAYLRVNPEDLEQVLEGIDRNILRAGFMGNDAEVLRLLELSGNLLLDADN